jgi:hypothetical protein
MVPNTAHVHQFTLCELWSRDIQCNNSSAYSDFNIQVKVSSSDIGDISTIRCALIWKLDAMYRAHPPVFAVWTVDPDIYNVITAPHIQSSIFSWTYLLCYWRYLDNSMSVILQSWWQIQRTSSSLHNVYCGPGHIQRIYSLSYSGHNIQLNESALQLEIFRHFDPHYTANLVSNTAHIVQFTLCELWSRTYTM